MFDAAKKSDPQTALELLYLLCFCLTEPVGTILIFFTTDHRMASLPKYHWANYQKLTIELIINQTPY